MLGKFATALIALPLGVLIVVFAVANRQRVAVALDPFSPEAPALSLNVPLFIIMLGCLFVGVMLGGIASWFRQSKWRRTARRLDADARTLRQEVETWRARARNTPALPAYRRPPAA